METDRVLIDQEYLGCLPTEDTTSIRYGSLLLSAPGDGAGGADLSDADVLTHLTTRGADWHADPYRLSAGPKCLLTLFGGGHLPGGVSGYDAGETRTRALNGLLQSSD